jgi:hypothetical protein
MLALYVPRKKKSAIEWPTSGFFNAPRLIAPNGSNAPAPMSDDLSSPLPLFTARSWAVAGTALPGASMPPPADVTTGLDLFQAAPETTTDGYSQWKAAMAAEKAAAEATRRRAELPVQADADGFARWKQESEDARRAFEKRWGIPTGKQVRVQLRGESREREGILRPVEEPQGSLAKQLRLTLGGHTFPASQIESLVRV